MYALPIVNDEIVEWRGMMGDYQDEWVMGDTQNSF